jgi:peptide/nickel transport system permease protein
MTGCLSRFLSVVLSLFLTVSLSFMLIRVLPGDAVSAQLGAQGASISLIEERRAQLGLNQPLAAQYLTMVRGLMQGDLGVSITTGESVRDILWTRGRVTLGIALSALCIAIGVGIGLGSMAALGENILQRGAQFCLDVMLAMPIPVGALFIALAGGLAAPFVSAVLVLGWVGAAPIANTLWTGLLMEARAGHLTTAWAKGLPRRIVFLRHRLWPVLPSIIPVVVVQAGFLLGGTVITETIFLQAGLGQVLVDSILRRDYPVVQGWVLLMVLVQAVVYQVGEWLGGWIDPRQKA